METMKERKDLFGLMLLLVWGLRRGRMKVLRAGGMWWEKCPRQSVYLVSRDSPWSPGSRRHSPSSLLACLGFSLLGDKTHIQVGEPFLLVNYLRGRSQVCFTDLLVPCTPVKTNQTPPRHLCMPPCSFVCLRQFQTGLELSV